MAELLLGKEVANALDNETKKRVVELKDKGIHPTLAIVRIGQRGDDIAYETSAVNRCNKIGISIKSIVLEETITQTDLIEVIKGLNQDTSIHGVLLFLPLPSHINEALIRKTLSPLKDVDGITDGSMAGVYTGNRTGFPPCTAEACMVLLDHYGIIVDGKLAVVVGRSLVIGKPVAMMLLAKNATVTVCHSKTKNLKERCKEADFLIVAAGKEGTVGADFLKPGQVVVDVGIHVDRTGKITGDVNTEDAANLVSAITPVPGGVGPITISILAKHVVEAAS